MLTIRSKVESFVNDFEKEPGEHANESMKDPRNELDHSNSERAITCK